MTRLAPVALLALCACAAHPVPPAAIAPVAPVVAAAAAPPPAAPETEITEQGQEPAMTAQDMQSFDAWLAGFRVLAQAQGVRAQTLDSAFAGLSPSARAIALDQAQPETRASYAGYLARRLTETKVARGRRAVLRAGDALATAQARTGVPASLVAAIWGMETDYGGFQGDFDVVRALATLAWEGRRAALFGEELLVALKLLDEGRLTRADYRGSWAGAYGMTQFMPSTVRDYAIDADGDGTVRLRESLADAMVSTANYLAQSGWRAGQGWGAEVTPPPMLDRAALARTEAAPRCPRVFAAHSRALPVGQWRALGLAGIPAAWADDLPAVLVEPDGAGGPAYLTLPNYRALLQYNCSNFYALSVALLADRLAQPEADPDAQG